MRKSEDFTQKRVNTTELYRRYSEDEIRTILEADLISRAAVRSSDKTCKTFFSSRDKAGTAGSEIYAEVRVIVDHDPPPKECAEPSA